MYSEALSWWTTPSNVIQTINEAVTAIENEFEQQDDDGENEMNGERQEQEDQEENEVNLYKKLLEDAQMQHVELSKHFRLAMSEKDVEIQILKEKYNLSHSNTNEEGNELSNDKITQIKLTNENQTLKETVSELETDIRKALQERNESLVKIQKFPELMNELNELRAKLSLRNENETKKSEEIDNLVQEYSKLAADSEKQKSSDTLRIRELELENEVMTTRLQALEHSITELADRSTSIPIPSSPSRERSQSGIQTSSSSSSSSSTSAAIETELKQLKAKNLNLEYDITEKNEKISTLENELKALQDTVNLNNNNNNNNNSSSLVNQEELKAAETALSRRIEEISNLQADVSRLQLEKQEAEATGKKFYEQLRSLQKEVEQERKKSQEESNNTATADKQQYQLELDRLQSELSSANSTIAQTKQENNQVSDQLKSKVDEFNQLTTQFHNLKIENEKLQAQLISTSSSNNATMAEMQTSLIESHQKELEKLRAELESKNAENSQSLQNEINQLKLLATSSSSEKDHQITQLQSTLKSLEMEKSSLIATHQQELVKLKSDLETSHLSNTDDQIKQIVANLTNSHNEKELQIQQVHESQMNELKNEIAELKNQINQLENQRIAEQAKFENEQQEASNLHQEKIQEIQNQHKLEIESLNKTHSENLENLREKLIEEGKEETQKAVSQTQAEALVQQEKLLLEQKKSMNEEHELEIEKTIQQQQSEKQNALMEQESQLEKVKEDAVLTLTMKLNDETDNKITNLKEEHSQQMKQLKSDCDDEMKSALEKLTSEHEENIRFENLRHEREMDKLKADHEDVVGELKNEISQVKDQLSQIESVHAEKLRKALEELTTSKNKEREVAVQNIKTEMQTLVDSAYAARDEYLALYTKENKARKALHNKLMDIQGNIRVLCRVRPILDVERRSGEAVDVTEILSDEDIVVHRDASTKNKFEFDRIFPPGTAQESVFEAVQPLIISVLDGYNVCIFAYGQTGSGKTFTMEGYGSDIGVSPRAIDELFRIIDGSVEDWSYTVTFSSLEIYNESIRDLLDSSGARDKLDVRQTPEGNSVPGLTEIQVTHSAQVLDLMRQSQTNRAVGAHDMNEHSSRSHSILTLTCRGRNLRDGSITTYGKLHLIDLAGSERVGKTDATGERLKEAQNINRSLSALGDVINSLGKKSTHIPYRNSKLTFLLQDSLGGNSKVLMFVNISPASYNVGESICSLGFAQRCRSLELGQAKKQSDTSVKKSTSSASLSSTTTGTSSNSEPATPSKAPLSNSSTTRRTTTTTSTTARK